MSKVPKGLRPDSDDWATVRVIELRQAGEQARFRICWRDEDGRRRYWLQVRRADGTLESPPGAHGEPKGWVDE